MAVETLVRLKLITQRLWRNKKTDESRRNGAAVMTGGFAGPSYRHTIPPRDKKQIHVHKFRGHH
eukprot:gene16281-4955_t